MSSVTLAQVSNNLVYGSLVVLALALLAFAADLAFGSGRVRARQVLSGVGARDAESWDGFTADRSPPAGGPREPGEVWGRVGVSLSVLAFVMLAVAVLTRGLAAERPPWGNMYEFSLTGALSMLGVWLFLLARGRPVQVLGLPVVLATLLTLGVAVVVLYTEAAQLVPALKSYWLWIHVSAAILASGVFTVGTAATLLFLVADRRDRRLAAGRAGGALDALATRLPPAATLDRQAYRIYAFAFPLWFFAIVAGAIWAEDAWGRYWGWDPKETWSFVTLVVYAAYLHARATAGWKGRKAAVIALVGYAAFLFNYFGVNIWFFGLHSYGGV